MTAASNVEIAAKAVALQGWTATRSATEVARALLGECVTSTPLLLGAGEWRVVLRTERNVALGAPSALIAVEAPAGVTIEVAMGSLATSTAPDERVPTWKIALAGGEQAVIDARCWFRFGSAAVNATLWAACGR